MVTQLLVLPAVSESVSERTALIASGAVSAVFYLAFATATNATQLVALSVPLVVANTLFQLINTSQVTRVAPATQRGLVVSLDMALFSAMRIPMPVIATTMLASVQYSGVCAVAAAANVAIAALSAVIALPAVEDGPAVATVAADGARRGDGKVKAL